MIYFTDESGFGLIIAVVVLLIFSVTSVMVVSLVSSDSDIALQQLRSTESGYIARAGIEKATYRSKGGTTCGSLSENSITLGSGSYDTIVTWYPIGPATTLSAGIDNTVTTIPVGSTANYGSHGRIRIDSEDIDYTGTTGTSFTEAKRGATAASHSSGALIGQNLCLLQTTGKITGGLGDARSVIEASPLNWVNSSSSGFMMVYAKENTDRTPYYIRWDGSSWGSELTANTVGGSGYYIEYMVLKFARSRNEAILGTMSSDGAINVQVWNGSTWGTPTTLATIGTSLDAYRGFDIEYETNGDRAIVVYNDTTADPNYLIWNGSTWTSPADINLPTTGIIHWIELAPNPLSSSNEIAMITRDSADDIYGMRWTGSAWDNMGVATRWADKSAASAYKSIDVAYEQQSGRAMFIWGDDSNNKQLYRTWDGSTLSSINTLTIGSMGGQASWVRLVPDPTSNGLMYGVQSDGRELHTRLWNGSSWDTGTEHPEHDNGVENAADRSFDIVFETYPANAGKAWLLWGNESTVSRKQWNGSSWGSATTVGDDTALVQLMAHPNSGAIFAAMYEDSDSSTDDIWEMRLTGGGSSWSSKLTVWGGSTVANPVMERVFIAAERYAPNVASWVDIREVY